MKTPERPAGHKFPAGVFTAAALTSLSLQVRAKNQPGESTMVAVPPSVPTPQDSVLFAQSPVSWDVNIDEIMDSVDDVFCSLTPGQKSNDNASMANENVVSMSEVGGEGTQNGNSRPGCTSQPPVTGGQPSAAAKPGQGLRGTQRAGPQAPALGAGQSGERNPLLNRGWEDVAARMAIISLPAAGRPYKRLNIEQALAATDVDCSTIITLGEFDNNFKYQVTFTTQATAEYFVRHYPTLPIVTDNGTFDCPVGSFLRREYRVKVAWFPDAGSDQEIAQAMSQWGEVLAVHREKVFGNYFSGVHIVTIIPAQDIDNVPDFADMRANGTLYTVRMTVIGLKARCHNCQRRRHLARECEACARCGSVEHATADRPPAIPFTTFADRVKGRRRRVTPASAPGDMDVNMPSVAPQQGPASHKAPNTVNALIETQLAARPSASASNQGPTNISFKDAEGFELPKNQRDQIKRRRGQIGKGHIGSKATMPDIEEADEETSDSEASQAKPKQPRTDGTSGVTEHPQSSEVSRGVDDADGGAHWEPATTVGPSWASWISGSCIRCSSGGRVGVGG